MTQRRLARACRPTLVFTGFMAVFALALPTRSFAQTVTPADLVGSWARQGEKEVRFTFGADSTLIAAAATNAGPGVGKGRWTLAGDTLVVSGYVVSAKGQKVPSKMDRRVLSLKDKLLTVTRVGNTEQGPKTRVYERVDPAKADSIKADSTAKP